MAKTKLRHFHKIKIHHNRWLIWAIAYALIVAIGVIGYIKVTDVAVDDQIAAENEFTALRSYKDTRLGFMVNYPGDWSIEAMDAATISFLPVADPDEGVTISVKSSSAESSIRESMDIISEHVIKVDSYKGASIVHDLGNGAHQTVALIKKGDKLYVVSGSEKYVANFLVTLRFVNLAPGL